jgi:hypothetical protein
MKQTLLSIVAVLLALPVLAVDTTPPELSVPHAWVEKVGTQYAFKLLLDPQDETGVDKIQYRYKVNSTLALPDATAWVDWAWQRGTPLRVQVAAKSFVIEVRGRKGLRWLGADAGLPGVVWRGLRWRWTR